MNYCLCKCLGRVLYSTQSLIHRHGDNKDSPSYPEKTSTPNIRSLYLIQHRHQFPLRFCNQRLWDFPSHPPNTQDTKDVSLTSLIQPIAKHQSPTRTRRLRSVVSICLILIPDFWKNNNMGGDDNHPRGLEFARLGTEVGGRWVTGVIIITPLSFKICEPSCSVMTGRHPSLTRFLILGNPWFNCIHSNTEGPKILCLRSFEGHHLDPKILRIPSRLRPPIHLIRP